MPVSDTCRHPAMIPLPGWFLGEQRHFKNILSYEDVQLTGQLHRDPREEPELKEERMSLLLCQTMHVHSALASLVAATEAFVRNVCVVFSLV